MAPFPSSYDSINMRRILVIYTNFSVCFLHINWMAKLLLFTNNSKQNIYLHKYKATNCKLPKVHDKTVFHERLHRVHLFTE